MQNVLAEKRERNAEVDALRGVALLGICIVNVPFLAGVELASVPDSDLNLAAAFLVSLFFQGKFFLLFSFLFGWGFAVQIAAARKSNTNWTSRYTRRQLGLASMGVAHALLVFIGDILLLYALLGFILLLMQRATVRTLLSIASGLIALECLTLATLAVMLGDQQPIINLASGHLGSFADAVQQRWFEWPFGFGFTLLFNGPAALGAFCVGLAAARVNFFQADAPVYRTVRSGWPILLTVGITLNISYAMAASGMLGNDWLALVAFSSLAIGGPCLSAVYLILFVELSRRGAFPGSQAVGRMSLTAYVAEGVLAGLIFNGYGLGLFGQTGEAMCLVLAVVIFFIVHWLCVAWLRWFAHGPLETVLRLMTDGKHAVSSGSQLKT